MTDKIRQLNKTFSQYLKHIAGNTSKIQKTLSATQAQDIT